MGFATSFDGKVRLWPGITARPNASQRSQALEGRLRDFFTIGGAIELTAVEQRIMLDVTAREMALLRMAPANALSLGGAKLERRVNYAIPILQRMIAAMAS